MDNKGMGQTLAEKVSANPFQAKTTMGMIAETAGSSKTPRFDAEMSAAEWPQGAVAAPPIAAPIRKIAAGS